MAETRASTADLRPQPWLAPACGVAFGLVLFAVLVADVPPAVRLVLLAAFGVAAAGLQRKLAHAAKPHGLAWDGRGGWRLDGAAVTVAPATRVYAGLVVLVLRPVPTRETAGSARDGARPSGSTVRNPRRTVLWAPRHAVGTADFRRLKAALRHGRPAPAGKRPENPAC